MKIGLEDQKYLSSGIFKYLKQQSMRKEPGKDKFKDEFKKASF
jgi:hypothetical protein